MPLLRGVPSLILLAPILLAGCHSTAPIERSTIVFTPQSSGTQQSLRGLCVLSEKTAWASGAGGTVLRTTDAGRTWELQPIAGAEKLDFRDIHACDERSAVVLSAGEPAHVFRTTDGGATWSRTHFDASPGVFFDALAFWDARRGIAFADPQGGRFPILLTTDGGASWTALPAERCPAALPGEAAFAASGTCLAVRSGRNAWIPIAVDSCLGMRGPPDAWIATGGAAARMLYTTGPGPSWSAADVPMAHGRPSAGVFSLAFFDDVRGVAVGGDYERPEKASDNVAVSDDGGRTWRAIHGRPPGGYRSCVGVVSVSGARVAVAVGPNGADLTTDGGDSWRPVAAEPLNAVGFAPTDAAGWAVGPAGTVYRVSLRR